MANIMKYGRAMKEFFTGVFVGGKYFFATLGGLYLIGDFVGYPVQVTEISMRPTINNSGSSEIVFLNRWCLRNYKIKNGDIIVFVPPNKPKERYIKRVIANENECVRTLSDDIVCVPKGHCWVEGDCVKHSIDSNDFGPLAKGLIIAKATHVVWPLSRWRALNSNPSVSRGPVRCPAVS